MLFPADAFASWLIGELANEGRKRLTVWVFGTDQERALRQAAEVAVRRTAEELSYGDSERAEQIALVVEQVFREPLQHIPLIRHATMLEAVHAGIADQLAPLDDPELTGVGQSSGQVLRVPPIVLAETLTSHLLREVIDRGARGSPLSPLASQLNDEFTHMQVNRIEDKVDQHAGEVLEVLARLESALTVTAPAATRTLPADVGSFTGRQAELDRLMLALPAESDAGGVIRIDAIDGMAGVGKTAFAVHIAHQLAPRFPDGQLLVRLHAHTPGQRPVDPADALASLLLTVGVMPGQIPARLDERGGMWRDRMAGRKMLLLFDDAAGSEQILPLLPGSTGTLVIITSRHRLTALSDTMQITLDILEAGEAAQLFVQSAGRTDLAPNDEAVAEVVALCGYLPLAIRLMAGQFKHHVSWTTADLAIDLRSAADRLGRMYAEHESVTAAFDLSYGNLPSNQQRMFRRLGLHPGTDFDAYAVAALNDTDVGTTRQLLDDLFSYHLLDESALGRYRFHDLTRQHARNKVASDPPAERDAVTDRVLDYYLKSAHAADRHLAMRVPAGVAAAVEIPSRRAPDLASREDAVIWMEAERLNLNAAAKYAATHGRLMHAIAIPAAMHGFLRARGYWDEALNLHRTALNAALSIGDRLAEAGALIDLGDMQRIKEDYPAATANLTRAINLCRDLGNRLGEANALSCLGAVQYMTDDYPAATINLTRAIELQRSVGNRLGEATALDRLGAVQRWTSEYPAAVVSLTRAIELHRILSYRLGEATSLTGLGAVQYLAGEYAAAAANLTQAVKLQRGLGNPGGECEALIFLTVVQRLTGDYPAAIASVARALDLSRSLDDPLGEANALNELGHLKLITGDYTAAAANFTRVIELNRDRSGQANGLQGLGKVQCATGDYAAATASLTQALDVFRDLGDRNAEAGALNSLGDLALASLMPDIARAHYERAFTIATEIGSRDVQARALEGIGRCHLQDGQTDEAAAPLLRALAIYKLLGFPDAQRVEMTLRQNGLSRDDSNGHE